MSAVYESHAAVCVFEDFEFVSAFTPSLAKCFMPITEDFPHCPELVTEPRLGGLITFSFPFIKVYCKSSQCFGGLIPSACCVPDHINTYLLHVKCDRHVK